VVAAALAAGADAVTRGYGFLAENAEFAQACIDAGLVWIGPPPAAIRAMGRKIEAKRIAERAGVRVLDGVTVPAGAADLEAAVAAATALGLPLLVKPSAGGAAKACTGSTTPAS